MMIDSIIQVFVCWYFINCSTIYVFKIQIGQKRSFCLLKYQYEILDYKIASKKRQRVQNLDFYSSRSIVLYYIIMSMENSSNKTQFSTDHSVFKQPQPAHMNDISVSNFILNQTQETQKIIQNSTQQTIKNKKLKEQTKIDLNSQLDKSKSQINRLKEEMGKYRAQLVNDAEKFKSGVKELNQQLDKQRVKSKVANTHYKTNNAYVENFKNSLKLHIKNLQLKSQSQNVDVKGSQKQKDSAKKNIQISQIQQTEYDKNIEKIKDQILLCREDQSQKSQTIKRLQNEVEQLKKDRAQLQIQIQQYKTIIRGIQMQISTIRMQNYGLRSKVQILLCDNEFLHNIKSQMQDQKIQVQLQLDLTRNQLSKQQMKDLKLEQLNELELVTKERNSFMIRVGQLIDFNNILKLQMEESITKLNQLHEQDVDAYRERIAQLELQMDKHRGKQQGRHQFDHILKVQLEESQKFKQIIQSKNQQIHNLHNTISQIKSSRQTLSAELDFQKVKILFQVKNANSQSQVEILQLKNDIVMLKKGIHTLEDKLDYTITEAKSKDQFIKEYVLKRGSAIENHKQYISQFFSKYEKMMEELRPLRFQKTSNHGHNQ